MFCFRNYVIYVSAKQRDFPSEGGHITLFYLGPERVQNLPLQSTTGPPELLKAKKAKAFDWVLSE